MISIRFLLTLILGASLFSTPAFPHGGGHDHAGPVPPAVNELEEHLHELQERWIKTGTPITEDEEVQVGQMLLDRASEEWQKTVFATDLRVDFATRAAIFASKAPRMVLDRVNLAGLGHWAIETAGKNGPYLAVTLGTTELLENITLAYGATHMGYWFFVPLSLSHTWDVIGVSLGMELPKALRTVKLWERHGGLFTGPHQYYRHLLEQRKVLPFDWDRVIDIQNLPTATDSEGAATGEVAVAIIRESSVERIARSIVPQGMRILLFPRSEAQRASAPTLSLRDLEKIAKDSGVSLKPFARLKSRLEIYSRFVMRELLSSEEGSRALRDLVASRTPPEFSINQPFRESFATDVEEILRAPEPEMLKSMGFSPDLVAQRVLWFSRIKDGEFLEELESQSLGAQWSGYKLHRSLTQLMEGRDGLRWIADTSHSSPTDSDWQNLSDKIKNLRDLHDQMDSMVHGEAEGAARAAAEASEGAIPSLLSRALEIFSEAFRH